MNRIRNVVFTCRTVILMTSMLYTAATALSDPVRLAVVMKDQDSSIADLVFARLAKDGVVDLVERGKLAAIVGELALSSSTRAADVTAGALLDANGLLFIEADAEFRHFILVETSRGERLFDLIRPRDEPLQEEVVEQVARLVERHAPKLTATRRDLRHVALVQFEREDGMQPRWHDLDVLTVLVGSTLAQHPQLIVVERENLADVRLESAISGDISNALATADFILRGSAIRSEVGRLKLNLRIHPSHGGEVKAASFFATSTNLSACAQEILDWVASALAADAVGDKIDLAAEATLYFERGVVYRAQGRPDPFRCFELAYELAPTNHTYATTYLGELKARWDQPLPLDTRCTYFRRALDVVQALDPEMKDACLPLPGFMLTMPPNPAPEPPWEFDVSRDARQAAESYYKRYCDFNAGLPNIERRNLWATLCPIFFVTPEEALRELRRVSAMDGYDWNLVSHRFLSVSYWDTKKAQELWLAYLDELCRHPYVTVQLQAQRAILYRYDFFSPHSYPLGGERTEVSTRFYDWFCSEPVQREYISGRVDLSTSEFWRTFWYLQPDSQENHWDTLVTPRILRSAQQRDDVLREVGYLRYHLKFRFDRAGSDSNEATRILRHVEQAQVTVQAALDGNPMHSLNEMCQSYLQEVEDYVKGVRPPPASPPDLSVPEIAGAVLLFDYRRDLPENLWTGWSAAEVTHCIVEKSRAWIGFTTFNLDHRLITVVLLDAGAQTIRVFPVNAPGEGYWSHNAPVMLAKTRMHICLAEFHNVLVLPLDDGGAPVVASAIFLGPEQGLPATGLRTPSIRDSFFVSSLASLGDDFYMGISRPLMSNWKRPINYGGLFRWTPDEINVTRVAACNSLEPGPFNDCAPYMIADATADETGRMLLLQVKQGMGIMQAFGKPKPWTFTPPATWDLLERDVPIPKPPESWRVTPTPDGKTFTLEYVSDGRVTPWQTFPNEAFSSGELTLCDAGLLWYISRERPMIYFIPRERWPKPTQQ